MILSHSKKSFKNFERMELPRGQFEKFLGNLQPNVVEIHAPEIL